MTTYGGTFAFMKNWLPRYNIEVTFLDITDLDAVKKSDETKHENDLYRNDDKPASANQ